MIQKVLSLLKKDATPVAKAATGFVPPAPLPPFPDAGKDARVVLYVEGWCSDSKKAERRCIERGWPTRREDLGPRHDEKIALFKAHGVRTLPLVFVDGTFIGGWKELQKLEALP